MTEPIPRGRWTERVHQGLCTLLEGDRSASCLAALDWDHTSIRGDISYALFDDLCKTHPMDLWDAHRQQLDHDVVEAFIDLARQLVRGRTPDEVATWTQRVMEQQVRTGELAWVPEIADLTRVLQQHGWQVWVVSGSPAAVIRPLAERIGIPPDRVIGMEAELDAEGRYVDAIREPGPWRQGKVRLLHERAGTTPSLAIGDSEGDQALLDAAEVAVLIDRGDPVLRRHAARQGWLCQEAW